MTLRIQLQKFPDDEKIGGICYITSQSGFAFKTYRTVVSGHAADRWAVEERMDGDFRLWPTTYEKMKEAKDAIANKLEDLIRARKEEREAEWERRRPLMLQERATVACGEYFDMLLHSIDRMREEVERHKTRFATDHNAGEHERAMRNIEFCTHYAIQFNSHSNEAVRASSKYAAAYKLEDF